MKYSLIDFLLQQILSHVDKSKASDTKIPSQKEEDGLSPVNIDNIESSAVALYNRDKRVTVSLFSSK